MLGRRARGLAVLAALLVLAGPSGPSGGSCQNDSDESDSDSSADEPESSSGDDGRDGSSDSSFYGFYGTRQRSTHRSARDGGTESGPQRRSGASLVVGRSKRQVAFTLMLPGIAMRDVLADEGAYAQLTQRLNKLLDNAVAEVGHDEHVPRWYHKLDPSSRDASTLEVSIPPAEAALSIHAQQTCP